MPKELCWVRLKGSTQEAFPELLAEAESLTTISVPPVHNYNDSGASAGYWQGLNATAVGQYMEYTVQVPKSGEYSVYATNRVASNKGIYQVSVDGTSVGIPNDQFQSTPGFKEAPIGNILLNSAGNHTFRFSVTGKNAGSSGFTLGFDNIRLVKSQEVYNEALSLTPIAVPSFTDCNDGAASGGVWQHLGATGLGQYIEYSIVILEQGTYSIYASTEKLIIKVFTALCGWSRRRSTVRPIPSCIGFQNIPV
ncbi:hypothetical protein [Paenibacillus sp. FSL H7-0714]|uniref:hypothetical protein n=1 Tax=Paenibacillus sp. FSL H7-0714 TaxID=2954735 RepID=UPI0030F73EE3